MKFGLEQHIIDKLIAVFEKKPKVDKALVFGSRAMGNYRPDSDIDIAIKGQDLNTDDIIAMSVAFEEKGITYKIDLINYHTIKEPNLKDHIDRVGIDLYSRWKEYKLGDVVTFQRGHDLTRTEMGEGEYPVAGSNGIIGYHNKFTTKGPGVTIGRSGNIGTPHFYESDFWAHNTVLYVKDFKVSEPKFIYYFLKTIDFSQFNAGSSVPTLNRNHIHELDFILPPLSEQTAIASILSSLDDKIDLLHHQNKTLEQLAETLFRQWFVEETEESWEIGTLDDEFDFVMGQSPLGSNLNEDKIGTIFYQGRSDFGFRFPSPRVYTTAPTRLAKPLDTLISVRAPVGDMNMAFEECCLGRGVAAFRFKSNSNYYSYTYYKLRSLMQSIKQFEDNGSVFGSIGKDDFKNLENIIPPQNFIEQFQKEAKPIDDKILLNEQQIRSLTRTRDTLLPKLMSGEVRVKIK